MARRELRRRPDARIREQLPKLATHGQILPGTQQDRPSLQRGPTTIIERACEHPRDRDPAAGQRTRERRRTGDQAAQESVV
jgi:hypothetical protein